jgi:hypothetical protein
MNTIIDDIPNETVISNLIKETGFNINQSQVKNNYKKITDICDKDVWYFSTTYINDLKKLLPFFKEKKLALFITLDEYYYHTGIFDRYGEPSHWAVTQHAMLRRNEHTELLLSLGFTQYSKYSFILS